MASSVTAIHDGFDYQGLWFWRHACHLLQEGSSISRIGYEVKEYVAFDDVALEYKQPVRDDVGDEMTGIFASIKYSVTFGKAITAASLADPALINADTFSLLQRLRDAVKRMENNGEKHLFALFAPWALAQDDVIQKLVGTNGVFRLEVLFDGKGARSVMGKLRKQWTDHLGLQSENELKPILKRLRILVKSESTPLHIDDLSVLLTAVGLAAIQKSEPVIQYFPLVVSMHKAGQRWFTREDILKACSSQNLLSKRPAKSATTSTKLGIRTFLKLAELMGDEVDQMLCLLSNFEGRRPKHNEVWQTHVFQNVQAFLSEHAKPNQGYEVSLQCFGSVAFLCGRLLDPKLGINVGILQRLYGKPPEVWTVALGSVSTPLPAWHFSEERVGEGTECAVVASVTHKTKPAVVNYCKLSLPNVGRILFAEPDCGASYLSIASGTHAFSLAEQLKNEATKLVSGRSGPVHFFWAAPNVFAFFFGQVSRSLGPCRLYEFDFEGTQTYSPSLDVTPAMQLAINN